MLDVDQIRGDFPILAATVYGRPLVYLDNAATTQKPRQVVDAVMEFYAAKNSNIHRGVHRLSEEASAAYEGARQAVKQFLRAGSAWEVIFTAGTTDAVNLVAHTVSAMIEVGDQILVTEMEHHSNLVPWQMLCRRKGAELKAIPLDDRGSLALEHLDTLLSRPTKLIAVTYVSNVLGTINPVRDIVHRARREGVPVLVDAAQAAQHFSIDVEDLDCDFLAFSGHKLYAETGIGVLIAKRKWLERLPPYRFGGGMIASATLTDASFLPPPLKFEAGTAHLSGAASLDAALRYLDALGLTEIATHERRVYDDARTRLAELRGVTVYGDAPHACGAISFNVDGMHHYDVGALLDKMGVAVRTGKHCAEPLMHRLGINGTVRASFALYNTREDVDALIHAIQKVQTLL